MLKYVEMSEFKSLYCKQFQNCSNLMTRKFVLLLFHFTCYKKLFLDEFSDIDMTLVENQEVATRMCSTKIGDF